ncbi:hypothetical protein A6R68_07244 [Neotoma lepida]|uniref:Uncharacterized protein n=1 Tax=Neotoma lepida TaxID=56216 RepID=A0A1A6GDB4_NEOLE|nr:hypothetical protein A6R68_07244 [Neotoma lepida]
MKQVGPVTGESTVERQGWWRKTSPSSGNSCHGLDTELISLRKVCRLFAHLDLFLSIGDQKHPGDQMVQFVKWYLSVCHAGRKGSVAKRP